MVRMPTQCCCGASLRLGTLVIGWLSLIGSALNGLSLLKFATFSYDNFINFCHSLSTKIEQPIDEQACANAVIVSLVLAAVGVFIGLLLSTLLLVGVNKNRPVFMLPFMIMEGAGISSVGIVMVVIYVLLMCVGEFIGASVFFLIIGAVMSLKLYLFMVVIACYREVKQYHKGMIGSSSIAYVEQRDHRFNYNI